MTFRNHWQVENIFQVVTQLFRCEIKTLADPKAALFSSTMASVAYNIFALLKITMAAVHFPHSPLLW